MELWFWIAVVVGAIVLAVILREVLCWYWKINQIRDLLADIRDRLPEKTINKIAKRDFSEDTTVICRKCGSFKIKDTHCPTCKSGWFGKKVSREIWDALAEMVPEQGKTRKELIKEMAVCLKCGTLKRIGETCPNCGAT